MNKKNILIFLILICSIFSSAEFGRKIEISIWSNTGNPEIEGEFIENAAGEIVLPFAGELNINNLDETQIKKKIHSSLHPDYFIDPSVSVYVKNNYFTINGKVKNPGRYSFSSRIMLSDAIEIAGGLEDGADILNVKIKNKENEEIVNYRDFRKFGKTDSNPQITNGSVITFNEFDYIYVLGEVENPFRTYYSPDIEIIELVLAAGYGRRSSLTETRILRGSDNDYKVYEINLNEIFRRGSQISVEEVLEPGDVLFIPRNRGNILEKLFRKTNEVANIFKNLDTIKTLPGDIF
ncbi:MAG: polysaccharide biosynthesis/export family protein [Candidatus Muiribacteriota bacterium]